MEIRKNQYIAIRIDYFNSYTFDKLIKFKEKNEILKFIKDVLNEMKFNKMIVYNDHKFQNKTLKNWAKDNYIELIYSVPFYHQRNGCIKRLNRTIRGGVKRMRGNINNRL